MIDVAIIRMTWWPAIPGRLVSGHRTWSAAESSDAKKKKRMRITFPGFELVLIKSELHGSVLMG